MAGKVKEDMQEYDAGAANLWKKEGSGDEQSAVKSVNGTNHEAEVTEVENSPAPPVDEVGESAAKESTMEEGESAAQDEEKDVKTNAEDEEEDEEAEGSKLSKC